MASRQDVLLHGSNFGATVPATVISATTNIPTPFAFIGVNANATPVVIPADAFIPVPVVYPPGPPGTYKPSASTTGYAAAGQGSLTTYPATGGPFGNIVSGVLTITAPGAVVAGWSISARCVYGADDITIRKCLLRGGAAITSGSDRGLVSNDGGFANAVLEDCNLRPDNPTAWINGPRADNMTIARNDISRVCDGMDLYSNASGVSSNTFVYANYIHDLGGYSPDSIARPFSHNDGIQVTDGLNITVVGNNFQGFLDPAVGQANTSDNPFFPKFNTNSVLQLTQGSGIVTGLLFDKNWVDGGGATLNLIATGQAARNIGSVTNNKFGRSSYFQGGGSGTDGVYGSGGDNGVTFLSQSGLTYTSTAGNVYEDNGHAITKRIS